VSFRKTLAACELARREVLVGGDALAVVAALLQPFSTHSKRSTFAPC
jgi:hypothetical protein